MATIVEGVVKLREGKKWKSRWCVVKKLSPVADGREQSRIEPEKSSLALDGFLGIEAGFPYDKEHYVLAVLCKHPVLLGFECREKMLLWEVKMRENLAEERRYLVQILHTPHKSKIPRGPAKLHLQNKMFCLASGIPPKSLFVWQIQHLRKFGIVKGKFCFEGGSRCGKNGMGLHILMSTNIEDLEAAFKMAAEEKLNTNQSHAQCKKIFSEENLDGFHSHKSSNSSPQDCSSPTSSHSFSRSHSEFSRGGTRIESAVLKPSVYSKDSSSKDTILSNKPPIPDKAGNSQRSSSVSSCSSKDSHIISPTHNDITSAESLSSAACKDDDLSQIDALFDKLRVRSEYNAGATVSPATKIKADSVEECKNSVERCVQELKSLQDFCRVCCINSNIDSIGKKTEHPTLADFPDNSFGATPLSSQRESTSAVCQNCSKINAVDRITSTSSFKSNNDVHYASPRSVYDSPRKLSCSSYGSDQLYAETNSEGSGSELSYSCSTRPNLLKMSKDDAYFTETLVQEMGEEKNVKPIVTELLYDKPKRLANIAGEEKLKDILSSNHNDQNIHLTEPETLYESVERLAAETNEFWKKLVAEESASGTATCALTSVTDSSMFVTSDQFHAVKNPNQLQTSELLKKLSYEVSSSERDSDSGIENMKGFPSSSVPIDIPRSEGLEIKYDRCDSFSFSRTQSASSGSDYEHGCPNTFLRPKPFVGSSGSSQLSCSLESTGSRTSDNILPIRPRMASLDSNLRKQDTQENYVNVCFRSQPCLRSNNPSMETLVERPEENCRQRHISGGKNYMTMEYGGDKELSVREPNYLVMEPKKSGVQIIASDDAKDFCQKKQNDLKNDQQKLKNIQSPPRSPCKKPPEEWLLQPFNPCPSQPRKTEMADACIDTSSSVGSAETEQPNDEVTSSKSLLPKRKKSKSMSEKENKDLLGSLKRRPSFFRQASAPAEDVKGYSLSYPPRKSPTSTRKAYSLDNACHYPAFDNQCVPPEEMLRALHGRSNSLDDSPKNKSLLQRKNSFLSRLSMRLKNRSSSTEDVDVSKLSRSAPETQRKSALSNMRRVNTFTSRSNPSIRQRQASDSDIYMRESDVYSHCTRSQSSYPGTLERTSKHRSAQDYLEMGQMSLPRPVKSSRQSSIKFSRSNSCTKTDVLVEGVLQPSKDNPRMRLATEEKICMGKLNNDDHSVGTSESSADTDASRGSNVVNVLRPRSAKDYVKVDRKNLRVEIAKEGGLARSDEDIPISTSTSVVNKKFFPFYSLPRRKTEPCKLKNIAPVSPQVTESINKDHSMPQILLDNSSQKQQQQQQWFLIGKTLKPGQSQPPCAVVTPTFRRMSAERKNDHQSSDAYFDMSGSASCVQTDDYINMNNVESSRPSSDDYVCMNGVDSVPDMFSLLRGCHRNELTDGYMPMQSNVHKEMLSKQLKMNRLIEGSSSGCSTWSNKTPWHSETLNSEQRRHNYANLDGVIKASKNISNCVSNLSFERFGKKTDEELNYLEMHPCGSDSDSPAPSPTAKNNYVQIDFSATAAVQHIGTQRDRQRREMTPDLNK